MRIVFDENTPPRVAQAIALLVAAGDPASAETIEVLHARDLVATGTPDVSLIERVIAGAQGKAALITADRMIRTRHHERAAFRRTGCIGIVLRGHWSHASLWERAAHTVLWWPVWVQTVGSAQPGTLWQCPWSGRPKALRPF